MNNLNYHQLPLRATQETIEIDDEGALIKRSVLPGGIRVISQQVPASRSVSLGYWIPAGSRDEGDMHLGSTHYLEHLLFKGSKTRDAFQIANAFDSVGGDFNAATAKESTRYYCRVLSRDLPMAVGVLTEMVIAPRLAEADFSLERTVILDELAMSADDPTDVAFENFDLALYGDSPLGRPVGGTSETVSSTPLSAVKAHHKRWYRPEFLVVAAAGDVNHENLCELLMAEIVKSDWQLHEGANPGETLRTTPVFQTAQEVEIAKEVEQAHVIIGYPSIKATDERRDAMSLLLTVLSGGMSARLFQEIREKRGLVYTTHAFDSAYTDTGAFGMYAGCNPANIQKVSDLMRLQLERLAAGELTEKELDMARGYMSGGVALGLESNSARMVRLGRSEVSHHQIRTVAQVFEDMEKVDCAAVSGLAATLISQPEIKVVVTHKPC